MKKNGLIIIILILLISCNNNKKQTLLPKNEKINSVTNQSVDSIKLAKQYQQKDKNEKTDSIEDNNTYLKGGFSILYSTDENEQYLVYKKGKKTIDTIGRGSVGLLMKNIGYIVADFDDSFVFAHSFGSGNPHMIELYEKETAKNLIKEYSAFIDIDSTKQVLLYSENDVPKYSDKMILYDTKTKKKQNYEFPKEVFGEPEILNRIHLINVTDNTFTIEFEFNDYQEKKQKSTPADFAP